jgi:hypothetical protein
MDINSEIRERILRAMPPRLVMAHGANVTLPQLATVLMALAVVLLLLPRSVKAQRELALDVNQAQEVEQVILPQAGGASSGDDHRVGLPAGAAGGWRFLPGPSA